jgi:hypothetical protein
MRIRSFAALTVLVVVVAAAGARADAPQQRPHPQVQMSMPSVLLGPRTAQELQHGLQKFRGPLLACYERVWKANPSLEGQIMLRVVVKPDGRVAGSQEIDDNVRSQDLSNCIQLRMRPLQFGAAATEARFDVRFTFSTAG